MSWWSKFTERMSRNLKFSVSNPENFEEVVSFNSSPVRVWSLVIIFILLIGFISLFFFSGMYSNIKVDNTSINRSDLERQNEIIDSLSTKLQNQDDYIDAIRLILLGEVPLNANIDSLKEIGSDIIDSLYPKSTIEYSTLAEKVKDDIRTRTEQEMSDDVYFMNPVTGVISQKYSKNHPAVDIVTNKGEVVKAVSSGTVIYADYTREDGYVMLIQHADGFISVYKHNKSLLKSSSDKVKIGDPIAIVGNTGENSDGPHLHFELWLDQQAVNPMDYLSFE